jgi:tRNA pseudouridine38-40 synthase
VPTYRLDLAYDGSGFHGYARQPQVRTVQGDLEEALLPHTGAIETFVAGRTDKGVHAIGQVVSFTTSVEIDRNRIMRSVNRRLAPAIAVQSLEVAPDDFHARFSASGRSYRYLILNRVAPDPFLAPISWHYAEPLDRGEMNAAAGCFLGERDFASLCRKAAGAGTVRNVRTAQWLESEAGLLEYRVEASSFCHQMVRSMVAICADVGRGKIEASSVPGVLDAMDRTSGRGAAPPHGLTLVGVSYGSDPATDGFR